MTKAKAKNKNPSIPTASEAIRSLIDSDKRAEEIDVDLLIEHIRKVVLELEKSFREMQMRMREIKKRERMLVEATNTIQRLNNGESDLALFRNERETERNRHYSACVVLNRLAHAAGSNSHGFLTLPGLTIEPEHQRLYETIARTLNAVPRDNLSST